MESGIGNTYTNRNYITSLTGETINKNNFNT